MGWVASWADARKKEVSIGPWYSNPIPHSELPFSPGVGRTLNFYPDLLSPLAYAVRSSASEVQHHTLLTFFFFFYNFWIKVEVEFFLNASYLHVLPPGGA